MKRVGYTIIAVILAVVLLCLGTVPFLGNLNLWLLSTGKLVAINYCKNMLADAQKYPVEELIAFCDSYEEGESFCQVKKYFEITFVRKTIQGYYTIVPSKTGENLFLFFDPSLHLTTCVLCGEFDTCEETDRKVQSVTIDYTGNRPHLKDANTPYYFPDTGTLYIYFFCSDGCIVASYKPTSFDELNCTEVCSLIAMKKFDNQELQKEFNAQSKSVYPVDYIPYILDMDRQNEVHLYRQCAYWIINCIIFTIALLLADILLFLDRIIISVKSKANKNGLLKWLGIMALNVPLFILCYVISVCIGATFIMCLPLIYTIAIKLFDLRKRNDSIIA